MIENLVENHLLNPLPLAHKLRLILSHQITAHTVCLNAKPAFNISSTCSSNKQVVRALNRCGKIRNLETCTYGKYSLRQASLSVAGNKRGGARIKLRTAFVA